MRMSSEIDTFIRLHVKGTACRDLTDLVNREFHTNLDCRQLRAYKKNHCLRSGIDSRFSPGGVSYNKGRKWSEYMSPEGQERSRATCFKPGTHPHTYLPIGTERVRDDGYLWRKVAEPNRWRQVHLILWTESHGPIPKGMRVTFRDNDRSNISLGNLTLVSTGVNLILNHKRLRSSDPTITDIGLDIARMDSRIGILRREGNKNEK